jgi:stress response protein YsnF
MLADRLIARDIQMPSKPKPDTGEPTVRLHAEDVTISRRPIAGDTLRVETITRERDHHIDESLSHFRVEVERIPVGRPVAAVPPPREEGNTTILSIVEEVIVVERRLILKEEVHIRRVHVAERHQETVVLREQSVEISRVEATTSPTHGEGHRSLPDATIPFLQEQK